MQTTYYYPHISGLTLWFQRLAQALTRRGHQITLVTAQHNPKLARQEIIKGVRVVRTPAYFRLNKGLFLPRILFDAYPHLKTADLVHFNLPAVEAFDLALAAKFLRKPIISTYVCDIVLPKFWGSSLFEQLVDLNHYLTLTLSDQIISFTLDYAQNSRVLKHFSKKVVEIYPPVELPVGEEKSRAFEIPSKLGFGESPTGERLYPLLGMAARFSADKGIEYLLNAIPYLTKEFPHLKIAFAGEPQAVGEETYQQKLQPLIEKYKERLVFLGVLSSAQMRHFYKTIDLLVVSSINSTEAFGIVQAESMLCSTPVVATDLPGVRVPIQLTGMGEIAQAADSADLAKKIQQVLQNKDQYIRPQAAIEKTFNLNQTIEAYEKLYHELLG